MGPFPGSKATNKLEQGGMMVVVKGLVNINPDFIDTVDEFKVESIQQNVFWQTILEEENRKKIKL